MSVESWARSEAERRYPASWADRGRTDRDDERSAFEEGALALADRLLSDETVEAAAKALYEQTVRSMSNAAGVQMPAWSMDLLGSIDSTRDARAALEAALAAVTTTKGDATK